MTRFSLKTDKLVKTYVIKPADRHRTHLKGSISNDCADTDASNVPISCLKSSEIRPTAGNMLITHSSIALNRLCVCVRWDFSLVSVICLTAVCLQPDKQRQNDSKADTHQLCSPIHKMHIHWNPVSFLTRQGPVPNQDNLTKTFDFQHKVWSI